MPRKKAEPLEEPKKRGRKPEEAPKAEVPVEAHVGTETPTDAPTPEVPKLPSYENVQVVKVLDDRGQFLRCEMSNGTTMDVPAHLFE